MQSPAESDLSPISLGFCLFLAMGQFVFGNVACLTLSTSSSAAAAAAAATATVAAIQFDLVEVLPFYLACFPLENLHALEILLF